MRARVSKERRDLQRRRTAFARTFDGCFLRVALGVQSGFSSRRRTVRGDRDPVERVSCGCLRWIGLELQSRLSRRRQRMHPRNHAEKRSPRLLRRQLGLRRPLPKTREPLRGAGLDRRYCAIQGSHSRGAVRHARPRIAVSPASRRNHRAQHTVAGGTVGDRAASMGTLRIMPLFAPANGGLRLSWDDLGKSLRIAAFAGFALCKLLGMRAFAWLAVRPGVCGTSTEPRWEAAHGWCAARLTLNSASPY